MEKTNCWALDYEPTFKTFYYNKNLKTKLKNILKNRTIHMNIYLTGVNGSGKNTIIKLILDYCFDLKTDKFVAVPDLESSFQKENILIVDFLNLHQNKCKSILEFVKKFSKKTIFSNYQKTIILKHIEFLEQYQLLRTLKNILNTCLNCKFIVSSNRHFRILNGTSCPIIIPKLDIKELKKIICSINTSQSINIKDCNLKWSIINKTYVSSQYNLKDTLLWYQYIVTSKNKDLLLINIKLISQIVKYIFVKENNLNNFEIIRKKITNGLSIGLTEEDILKTSIKLIFNNKNIKPHIKQFASNEAAKYNLKMKSMDRIIFALESVFFNIHIHFLNNH